MKTSLLWYSFKYNQQDATLYLKEYINDVRSYERQILSFFYICVSVHHQSIILINQLDVTLCSLIYSLLRFTLHVSGAFCTHHQEYN
jgi:hypothetical protein